MSRDLADVHPHGGTEPKVNQPSQGLAARLTLSDLKNPQAIALVLNGPVLVVPTDAWKNQTQILFR